MSPLAYALKGLVLAYRYTISAWVGHGCRFRPTCSEYAIDAITAHGAVRGGWLSLRRLSRCHPWGGSGWDPVPGTVPARPTAGRSDRMSDDDAADPGRSVSNTR
ncbi:MAG: membrane protein insertion efficiency factor YidD [Alphaproteobacteria bacterium]